MGEKVNTKGIPASKLDYLEKIQELYKGNNYFLDLQNSQPRHDYYDQSVDPDGVTRNALLEEEVWKLNNRETVTFVQESVIALRPNSVLDFGCGPGWLLSSLDTKAKKFGVDNSPMARSSAQRFADVGSSVYELNKENFDLIIMNHVLEHISNPVETLIDLIKKLSPAGHLIIGMPDFSSAMAHRYVERYRMLNEPTHISLFTLDSTLLLLRKLGLEICRVEFPFFDSPYFTKNNLLQILSTESQSPPFFGNFFLIRGKISK